MSKYLKKVADNWGFAVIGIFFIVTFIYLIIVGDRVYIQVHDNLDSSVALYKMLKDNNLYWTFGQKVPFLGGIDRNYLYSDIKAYTWLHMLFPTLWAIIIGWYLKIIISIIGFYLLGKTIYGNNTNKNIYIVCGLIYGLCPTFPTTPFGFASLPLLMYVLLLLYRKNKWEYMISLLAYPLLSEFSFFGIFICGYLLAFFIIDWFIEKKCPWRFISAIICLTISYIITEWRLFYVMLFTHQESIKSTLVTESINSLTAIKQFITVFIYGHYHSGSSHTLIVLPTCLLYFIWLNYQYIKNKDVKSLYANSFNWLMLLQVFNCVIYAFRKMEWFNFLMATILPPLKGFNFARTLWFSPFLWYFTFLIIICRVTWKNNVKIIICILAFVSVCLSPNIYNHIYRNCVNFRKHIIGREIKQLSYGEFYFEKLFDKAKTDIG